MSPRKAVVLVHGMGNQVPLTSIREFVEIFKPNNEQLYSSPDRIMGDFETRRFSYSKEGIDYYEFYWAHLMKEPTMSDIIIWSFKLIFCKDLSDRARIPIYILRVLLSALVVYIGYLVIHYGNKILEANELINAVLSGIGIFLVYKILFPAIKSMLSNVIVQSMG
ncbi:MAG: hypothetical protein KDE26_21200 [Bacteroidetes bacterium]|nr:hypothetical protein [Bacteroidota bacterium]MCB9270836.1 hypothetical protein [Lewinellaceae bacterium]